MAHQRRRKNIPQSGAPIPAGEEVIEKLAYEMWLSRGSPEGSPEQDWHEAKRILNVGREDSRVSASEKTSPRPSSREPQSRAAGG